MVICERATLVELPGRSGASRQFDRPINTSGYEALETTEGALDVRQRRRTRKAMGPRAMAAGPKMRAMWSLPSRATKPMSTGAPTE